MLSISDKCMSQELSMFQGFWSMKYYQDSDQISKKQVGSLMLQDKVANNLWQKSKSHALISYVALGAELGFLVWLLQRGSNGDSQVVPLVGGLATAVVGIGFALSSSSLMRKAILKYNQSQDIGSLQLAPTYNGYGLVLSF